MRTMGTRVAVDVVGEDDEEKEKKKSGEKFDGLFLPARGRRRHAGRKRHRGVKGWLGVCDWPSFDPKSSHTKAMSCTRRYRG